MRLLPAKCLLFTAFLFIAACAVQTDHPESRFGLKAASPSNAPHLPKPVAGDAPKPLDLNKRTFLILQVDGGGIMGITPACLIPEIETALAARSDASTRAMNDAFSVCLGTSTGSIISGMVAAGVSGQSIANYYREDGYELFTGAGKRPVPVWPLAKYRYRRDLFQGKLFEVLENQCGCRNITLNDLYQGPLLIIPAFDLCSRRTHFFRTREPDDSHITFNGEVQLVDAISASAFSAPLFFGKLPAPEVVWDHHQADGSIQKVRGAVYNDGGQGTQNSAIAQGLLEGILRNWASAIKNGDQIVMISLGTGNNYKREEFERIRKVNGTAQALQFILGNQARGESTLVQWALADAIEKRTQNLKFFRFDWVPDPGQDGTNTSAFSVNAKQRDLYIRKALEIAQRPDFKQLMRDLQRVPLVRSGPPTERPAKPQSSPKAMAL
jgi:patatin-like phospholipase/acyl hydrolase